MAADVVEDPFGEGEIDEIPLGFNPLILALFQVRFPGAVSTLQEAIENKSLLRALADEYPYVEPQDIFEIVLQPGRSPEPQRTSNHAWRLSDPSRTWFATLSPDSVSLYSLKYESREDFMRRVELLTRTIQDLCKVPAISRLGLRYTNRIEGWDSIQEMLPHLAGPVQGVLPLVQNEDALGHAMAELTYNWSNGHKIAARWGVLPSGATLDAAMPSSSKPSWVLDADVYREGMLSFCPDDLVDQLTSLSKRAYRVFRWAVLPSGLKQFGVDL